MGSFESLDVLGEYTKSLFVHKSLLLKNWLSEYKGCGGGENDGDS
jgi:hypothetical protein